METSELFAGYAKQVEVALEGFVPKADQCPEIITKAVSYSLLGGGKRIRPALAMEFYRICGGNPAHILPIACSLEMIHSYSLIHDDLPCMDNDDMRRGKPSNHVAFGEANALLAGDALLTLAFETISKTDTTKIPTHRVVQCFNILAHNAGMCGMVGGQVLDLLCENQTINEQTLCDIQYNKTGQLIIAAALMGCTAGGADEEKLAAAKLYAENIGRIFQMIDDILDVTSDEQTLGKPVFSDIENNKTTFVTLYGVEGTFAQCERLNEEAKNALSVFGDNAEHLKNFADYLLNRKK